MNIKTSPKPNLFLHTTAYSSSKLKSLIFKHPKAFTLNFNHSSSLINQKIFPSLSKHIAACSSLRNISVSISEIPSTISPKTVIRLLDSIQKHSQQSSLSFTSNFSEDFPIKAILNRLAIVLPRLKNLKNLKIVFNSSSNLGDLLHIYAAATRLRLKSLHLDFKTAASEPMKLPQIPILTKLLSKLPTLQAMNIDIDDPTISIENSVALLNRMMTALSNLKKISVGFSEDMDLAAFLPSAKKLEILEIRALEGKISGLGFLNLSEALEQMTRLRSLTLAIDGIDKATEPTAENFGLSLTELQNLRDLNLKVHKPSSSNNLKLQRMFEFLNELSKIMSINLDLSRMPSAKLALKEIGKGLKNQKYLEEISLNLLDCCLTDLELSALSEGLSGKQRLKNAYLNFKDNKQVIGAGIVEILRSLKDNSGLKSVFFDFSGIGYLNDQSLRGFFDIIGNNENLNSIGLVVSGCKNLTDDWVWKLADNLKLRKELKAVIFGFTDCYLISDKSFVRLVKTLSGLKKLSQFCFGIEKCQISNKGILYLKDQLDCMKELKYFQLKCSGFKNISHDVIVELGSALNKAGSLVRVGMDQYPFRSSKDEPIVVVEDCGQTGLWQFL